jgi:nitroreductase
MGRKKQAKKKDTRLDKKLRRLAESGSEGGLAERPAEAPVDVADLRDAIVPAELQLGGGDLAIALAEAPLAGPSVDGHESRTQFALIEGRPSYDLFAALQERRTHKRFVRQPVARRAIEVMLEAAVLAPNHKMTEPWRFVVFGEEAKRRYGLVRARAKVGRHGKAEKRAKIVDEIVRIPAMIAVKMRVDEDPVRREEDYAATFMAVQNLSLAATGLGLGTKINTGKILDDDELRELVDARRNERIVALLNIGVPADARAAKERTPASARTVWLD